MWPPIPWWWGYRRGRSASSPPRTPRARRPTTQETWLLIRGNRDRDPDKAGGMSRQLLIFSGNANRPLAEAICQHLEIPLGKAVVDSYRNGETRVLLEESVRGADVFVVQPTCTPVNHHLMEMLIMLDALKRASAARITAVIPYYGYAKQEKKSAPREPISAKLVANLIAEAGADRVLTCDLHAPAIEGFFDIPVDHLQARMLLAQHLRELQLRRPVVVAPDAGRVGWAL